MRKFFKEFKAFISKGNVFDMAVGLIIATAFNKIVSSMVNDIIMPLVTWATGASSLDDLSIVLKTTIEEDGEIVKLTWNYGKFLQTVLDFLIIALSVFIMVKVVTSSRKKLQEMNENIAEEVSKDKFAMKIEARKIAKAEGRKYRVVKAELEAKEKAEKEEAKAKVAAEKKAKELEDRKLNPTDNDLLKEIRDLLKKENKE